MRENYEYEYEMMDEAEYYEQYEQEEMTWEEYKGLIRNLKVSKIPDIIVFAIMIFNIIMFPSDHSLWIGHEHKYLLDVIYSIVCFIISAVYLYKEYNHYENTGSMLYVPTSKYFIPMFLSIAVALFLTFFCCSNYAISGAMIFSGLWVFLMSLIDGYGFKIAFHMTTVTLVFVPLVAFGLLLCIMAAFVAGLFYVNPGDSPNIRYDEDEYPGNYWVG